MLFNLQVLRGCAALGVAFYHTGFNLAGDWHTDFSGVAVFFVISGFIMCFITRENAEGFLTKRFIRVIPMYWLGTLAFVALRYGFGSLSSTAFSANPTLAKDLFDSLLFLPSEKLPVLGVGWTLNFEIYFYLVFGVALWISRRFAPLICAAVIYTVILLDRHGYGGFLIHYYSHDYIHYFLAGIALFYVWEFGSSFVGGWFVVAMCWALIVCFFGAQFIRPYWPNWILAYYWWFPPLVVGCALFAESSGAKVSWKPAVLLGDSSYSLYLSHPIFYGIERALFRALHLPIASENVLVTIFEVVAAALVGIAIHLCIEKPLLRKLKQTLDGRRRAAAQAA
ncbi:acyltransferase [Bradyrhizobium sp.]|uniref:acyltransferase family protein n=1 Tax=Bradyrhizobium sp. TaxID=376 RepID=UPI002632C11E|nr:acyltransferase [Bradyrhizobium sp.]